MFCLQTISSDGRKKKYLNSPVGKTYGWHSSVRNVFVFVFVLGNGFESNHLGDPKTFSFDL